MSRLIDEIGHRYGKLLVVERAANNETYRHARWLCKCACNNTTVVAGLHLRQNRIKSCGCLEKPHKLATGESAFNKLYKRYTRSAKNRGFTWKLSKDKMRILLTQQPCTYCNSLPKQIQKIGSTGNGNYVYNGIDRLDSTIGYIEDNLVSCCKTCNYAKQSMGEKEFRTWICSVYENWGKK